MGDHDIFSIIRNDSFDRFLKELDLVHFEVTATQKRTMLHMAIAYKKPLHAYELIKRGVNVNAQDTDGQTPLHYAAMHGEIDIAKTLLNHGAKQQLHDRYGNAPLWYAVFNARGAYDFVELLMKAGGDQNHKNASLKSPLDFAIQINDGQLVKILHADSRSSV
jgi:uncharacterized protein